MTDGPTHPARDDSPEGPYTFTGLIATSWRFYTARFVPLFLLFATLATFILALPLILLIEMPDQIGIMIALFVRFAVPAMIASYGVAVCAVIHDFYLEDELAGARASMAHLKPQGRHVLSAALLSGIIGLAAVTFLNILGVILLPLFYGPPIVMQVVALEKLPLADAWARTRQMMRGHWLRVISYLLTIALAIGVLGYTVISTALAVTDGGGNLVEATVYIFATLVVTGITYPFLATAQFIAYADIAALSQDSAPRSQGGNGSRPESPVLESSSKSARSAPPTHYEILGLRAKATQRQVRRAFDRRMKLLDPVRHEGADTETKAKIADARARAEAAFEVLSDPERRAAYDDTISN